MVGKAAVAAAVSALGDLILPVCCAACDKLMPPAEPGIVCGHCWSRVRELPHPRCERCGHPSDKHACRWCQLLPPFVRAARSYCWMGAGTGEDIVYALKYDGWTRVADAMAARMARVQWLPDVVEERSAIVPVPLSTDRQRDRGFNQSAVIAAALARRWRIPVWENLLFRSTGATSQTQLTPGERKSNVAGAFAVHVSERGKLRGEHIVLLDDVVTTGATLRACATALFASGARTISYMTFGRAPASGDRLIP
ncbi:MAG: ComF family protein [Gemmatimonadaceae bacterium]